MLRGVPEEVRVKHRDVRDPFAIGRPCGLTISARICGDLREMCAFIGVVRSNDPDIGIARSVGIGHGAVAGKGELLPIRRPCRLFVVKIARSDLRYRFLLNVENVEVTASIVEITDCVFLELKPVNHIRRLRFRLGRSWLVFIFLRIRIFRFGILEDQNEARAIRRPLKVADTLSDLRKPNSFAADTIEKPYLALAVIARGSERQIFAVRTPPRMAGRDTFGGHGERIASVRRDHPNPRFVLIFLEHLGAHGIRHPLAIWTQLGLADIANLEVIVNRDVAGSAGRASLLRSRVRNPRAQRERKDE